MENKKGILKMIGTIVLFLMATFLPIQNKAVVIGLYVVSYLCVGLEIILKSLHNIRKGEIFDENLLMTIATIGAFAIGKYAEAIAVMLLYQIGEMFQDYATDKSKKSITELMDIRPDYANLKQNGQIQKVNPNVVKVGDIIVVKPGEKIPLDGILVKGDTMLDMSALTGESVPQKVEEQEEVLSGCINMNHLIEVKVTKVFQESTVSKILDLVQNSSHKKSKSENFITKFAKYYTPVVVIVAFLLAVGMPLLTGEAFSKWVYRALVFLVISCPCALVISVPLSFFAGIGASAKKGILVKGGNYLEQLAKAQIMVFDKTGTLTKGVFRVQKMMCAPGVEKEELLRYAAYAENYSTHPIAHSVLEAYGKEIDTTHIEKVEELTGKGIQATIEGKELLVGNDKLMQEFQIPIRKVQEIGTILYVAMDGKYAGYLVIADETKVDAVKAMQDLRKQGVEKLVMLTGDKKQVGEAMAKKLQMDQVYSELLPDQKVAKVEALLQQKKANKTLAFIGDGINDAPVLARADIGIAMGAMGSDAAIEAADIVLMTDEPSKIAETMKIARKTLRIVKENIVFAISVKILILILGAFGISTMWEAVFADVGVSFLAILNAIRVLKVK